MSHTMLPGAVKDVLYKHLQDVKRLHEEDLQKGLGRVVLPNALEKNIRMRVRNGDGSGCFRQPAITPTG
jgi:hypothetical protein